jgi:radical SAM protein with 4Fe4S-binding SPASM domain
MSRQERADEGGRPWCVQPELTEGCSMSHGTGPGGLCHFCGLGAIRNGPGEYKFMTTETAQLLAQEMASFCPKARIEFAMRGEPLMNPKHRQIFEIFRNYLPKAQMMVTTNGDTMRSPATNMHLQRMVAQCNLLFSSGINFILMDTYLPEERRRRLRDEAYGLANHDIRVIDYFKDWMPIGKSPYANSGQKIQRTVVLMDDLSLMDGTHGSRMVKTHAGSNPTSSIDAPLNRSCGRPFREMTITWDGDFTLCCDDWRHQYVIGNIGSKSMKELWQHPRIEAARARLMNHDRSFGPCASCDAPAAPRYGLLPLYGSPTPEEIALTEQITNENAHIIPLWSLKK